MIAKDIMTRDIITVTPTMTVKNLAMTLIKNQISGAPVSGKNGKIVGVVSEADIVAKRGKDVKAIMNKKIISVKEETPVEEIAQLMTTHKISGSRSCAKIRSWASSAVPISSALLPSGNTWRCTLRFTIFDDSRQSCPSSHRQRTAQA